MTINEFIKKSSSKDSPIGDLANDILEDKKMPSSRSEREIVEYLNFETKLRGTNDTFQRFLAEYRKGNNETLKLILNCLKENNIKSIEDALELETMNEKWVQISNGNELQSHMLSKPKINDGMNISFCSQKVQFEFLLSLIE